MLLFLTILILCGTLSSGAPKTTTGTSTVSNTTPPTSKPLDIHDSAIFFCGNLVYDDTLIMLFPPSDSSLSNIGNATRAKLFHTQTYDNFCDRRLDSYISCVQDFLINSSSVDEYIPQYIDLDKFGAALKDFCNASVPTQFMCTKEQVEKHSCPKGGMYGIINFVATAINNRIAKATYCSELQASIRCRVDRQLKKCNKEFADRMELVYTKLTSKYCLPVRI